MPLIWTDDDERVTHSHYKPDEIPYSKARDAIEVDSIPDPNSENEGTPQLYYTDENGFWYVYE